MPAIKIDPNRITLTDRSGSIATGATAQQLAAANGTREYLLIQNVSAEDIWINFGITAVADQPSIKIAAGQSREWTVLGVPTASVSIIAATTGSKFVAKEA